MSKLTQHNTRTPNLNRTSDYKDVQRKQALSLLKQVVKRIERGELDVLNHGSWMGGTPDSLTIRVDLKESGKY